MNSEEFRRQFKQGLAEVFGGELKYDYDKARYVFTEAARKQIAALDIEADEDELARAVAQAVRFKAQQKYRFDWTDPRLTLALPKTDELGFEPSTFKIRWWHRVIHWLWKWARRYT